MTAKITDPTTIALLEARESAARLGGMLHVYQKADRTLAGMPVDVEVTNQPFKKAPGWSDGKTITFNLPEVGRVKTTDDLIKVTGLNYHELGHIMYTPRERSFIVRQVQMNHCFGAFNMLEDQRLETFMTSRFLSTKPYFQMMVLQYLLQDQSVWDTQHALIYGRKYLPQKVRAEMRNRFKGTDDVRDEIESLIDQYRQIVYPLDEQNALRIILRYDMLLKGLNATLPHDPYGHSKGARPSFDKQKPFDGDEQESTAGWVEFRDDQNDQDDDDTDDEDGHGVGPGDEGDEDEEGDDQGDGGAGDLDDDADDTDDNDDTDDTDGNGGGSDDGDFEDDEDEDDFDVDEDTGTRGSGETDGEGDSTDGDDDGDSAGSGEGGDQEGAPSDEDSDQTGSHRSVGHGGSNNPDGSRDSLTDQDLQDVMSQAYDDAFNSEEVQRDAKLKEKAIAKSVGKLPMLDVKQFTEAMPSTEWRKAMRAFNKELLKVWADSDPGWNRRFPSGRLNVGRAMRGGDLDTLFDVWDEGKTAATDIDMVILVDYSISMSSLMDTTSQALWAIKRAVEQVGGEVTVLGFNEEATTMYTRNDKAPADSYRKFSAQDYTNPKKALAEAYTLMMHSRAHHKIVLILTDGAWSDYDENNEIIDVLNAQGCITALGYLAEGPYDMDRMEHAKASDDKRVYNDEFVHHCKAFAAFNEPAGLVKLAKVVVKEAMRA